LNVKPETIKPLEENLSSKLLDIDISDAFFRSDSKGKGNKSKNRLHKTKKLLHSEGNHQQNKKAIY